ncbi:MAG: hypothetical protein U0Q16_03495 [Bryobacteraceae bacterium]
MSLKVVLERELPQARPVDSPPWQGIEIVVLYTGPRSTRAALRTACQCAEGLSARIRLLAFQPVPWALPLDQPPAGKQFSELMLRELLEECAAEASGHLQGPVEFRGENRLCRETWFALSRLLHPQSVVVIGTRTRWWPKPEDGLARRLRRAGHHVVRGTLCREVAYA